VKDHDEENEDEDDDIELPDKNSTNIDSAILPRVLRDLVQKRRIVKDQMKKEKDPIKL